MNRRGFLKAGLMALGAAAAAPTLKYLAPVEPIVQVGRGSALMLDNLGGYLVPPEFAREIYERGVVRLAGTGIRISQELLDDAAFDVNAMAVSQVMDELQGKANFWQWLENGLTDG